MKKIYFLFTLLLISQFGQAQTDATFQTTRETGSLEKQHIIPIKNCFSCTQGDVMRAFKFGYTNLSAIHQPLADYAGSLNFPLHLMFGYEQRIATGFSITTNFLSSNIGRTTELIEDVEMDGRPLYQRKSTGFKNRGISIGSRWYFQKKQQIKAGKSGNNLNGTYIGLQLSNNWWSDGDYIAYEENPFNGRLKQNRFSHKGQNQTILVNLGWQQQFYDNGFVHFTLGTGMSRNTQDIQSIPAINEANIQIPALSKWKWLLNYQVTWGTVIGRKNKLAEPTDNFIEYYEEAKDMWKIDLFNVFQGLNEKGAIGRLHIAYERKINNSQFSIENGLQYLYSFDVDSKRFDHQFVYQVEPRFYYRLRKDTRKGMAANNLSSMYFGILNQWNIVGTKLSSRKNTYNYDVTWGTQFRFFNHLYGDFRIGLGLQNMVDNIEDYPIFYDFRFGIAF